MSSGFSGPPLKHFKKLKQTKLPFGFVVLGFDNVNAKVKVKGTNSITAPLLLVCSDCTSFTLHIDHLSY